MADSPTPPDSGSQAGGDTPPAPLPIPDIAGLAAVPGPAPVTPQTTAWAPRRETVEPSAPAPLPLPPARTLGAAPGGAKGEDQSEGSLLKNVAAAAAAGAAGASTEGKAAGAGVTGAAAGAGKALLKSKKGRTLIAASILLPGMVVVIVLTTILSMLASSGAVQNTRQTMANDAAVTTGMESVDVRDIEEIASERNVPWEIIAAVEYINDQRPRGHGIHGYNDDVAGDEYAPDLTAEQAEENKRKAREFLSTELAKNLSGSKIDSTEYPLSAGAKFNDENSAGQEQFIDFNDKSSMADAERAKELYLPAIEGLPLEGNPELAEEIYTVAQRWSLGQTICSANDTVFVGGEWTSPVEGRNSSGWGPRVHPIFGTVRNHAGDDIAAPMNTPIYAAASGTVEKAGPGNGYGNMVIIDHGGGYKTLYGHIANGATFVSTGDKVQVGQKIAGVGSTGQSTGPHLHFEVHVPKDFPGARRYGMGWTTDPTAFMLARGVKLGDPPGVTVGEDTTEGGEVAGVPGTTPEDASPTPPAPGAIGNTFTGEKAPVPFNQNKGGKVTIQKEQIDNAKVVVGVGRRLGVSDRGLVIAIMVAMQESGLRALNYGDRDSLGIFQQRAGWGTASERKDPDYSSRAFFGGPTGPNYPSPAGLLQYEYNDTSRTEGYWAQMVQRSFDTNDELGTYTQWKPFAEALVAAIGGTSLNTGCSGAQQGLRIATYNVCSVVEPCASKLDPWVNTRAARVADSIKRVSPDVIGMQEMSRNNRVAALSERLGSEYTMVRKHRGLVIYAKASTVTDVTATGEKLPSGGIEFKNGPGASKRYGVYQVLTNLATGKQFLLVNYHTSASMQPGKSDDRKAEITDMFKKISGVRNQFGGIPLVVVGDMNAFGRSIDVAGRTSVDDVFEANSMTSAEDLSLSKLNFEYDSYNGFRTQEKDGKHGWHLDHVYVQNGTTVTQWGQELNTGRTPAKFEADHNMIWADVSLS